MRTPLLPQRWVLFEYSSFDQFPNIKLQARAHTHDLKIYNIVQLSVLS